MTDICKKDTVRMEFAVASDVSTVDYIDVLVMGQCSNGDITVHKYAVFAICILLTVLNGYHVSQGAGRLSFCAQMV